MRRFRFSALVTAAALFAATSAHAHFIFLIPQTTGDAKGTVQIYMSEEAAPDSPALLNHLTDLTAWQVKADGKVVELQTQRKPQSLELHPEADGETSLFLVSDEYGVMTRGEVGYKLMYYAKAGPAFGHAAWSNSNNSAQLRLDIQPEYENGEIRLTVRFDGKPVEAAQVVIGGGDFKGEALTDANGRVAFATREPQLYSIRARHIEQVGGEEKGKKFTDTRHYSTLALNLPVQTAPGDSQLAALEQPVTSFGAAVAGGNLYIYGGHTGSAHSYSNKEQGDSLLKLSLDGKGTWETLNKGPALQGLSLVAHGNKLYRLGGFTAKNESGQDSDLWSQAGAASYDIATGVWTDLPALPEARSSFDAAVIDDSIYVVGGWQLQGKQESVWHPTAWKLDVSKADAKWEAIAQPSFNRRALAVAEHGGKLYVIGGMQEEGGPTRRVDVYDPQSNSWSEGPALLGERPLTGFGPAAFASNGVLYVGTSDGKLMKLAGENKAWEEVRDLPTARFFHRMLPVGDGRMVVVGGANMGSGHFDTVEVINVTGNTAKETTAAAK